MKNYVVKKKCTILLSTAICVLFFQWQMLLSQTSAKDTSRVRVVQSSELDSDDGELVLDVIEIKGYVDKPGVTIIPKRVDTEMEEREIGRSFEHEVKQGVGEIPMPEDDLRKVDRVQSIKKAIDKKRK